MTTSSSSGGASTHTPSRSITASSSGISRAASSGTRQHFTNTTAPPRCASNRRAIGTATAASAGGAAPVSRWPRSAARIGPHAVAKASPTRWTPMVLRVRYWRLGGGTPSHQDRMPPLLQSAHTHSPVSTCIGAGQRRWTRELGPFAGEGWTASSDFLPGSRSNPHGKFHDTLCRDSLIPS